MLVLLKTWDPTKTKRGRGNWSAITLTFEDGSLFLLLSFLTLYFYFSLLCCLLSSLSALCQAFIKQLEEGVSFPWSSCQLFPISPAPWKSLADTPLSRPGAEPVAGPGVYAHMFKAGAPAGEVILDTAL